MPRRWTPPNTFGVRLATVRNVMKWNIKEAALACNVPAASWREWELFGRKPHDYQEVCERISHRTDCDLFWLMSGKESPDSDGDQVSEGSSDHSRQEAPNLRLVVSR